MYFGDAQYQQSAPFKLVEEVQEDCRCTLRFLALCFANDVPFFLMVYLEGLNSEEHALLALSHSVGYQKTLI